MAKEEKDFFIDCSYRALCSSLIIYPLPLNIESINYFPNLTKEPNSQIRILLRCLITNKIFELGFCMNNYLFIQFQCNSSNDLKDFIETHFQNVILKNLEPLLVKYINWFNSSNFDCGYLEFRAATLKNLWFPKTYTIYSSSFTQNTVHSTLSSFKGSITSNFMIPTKILNGDKEALFSFFVEKINEDIELFKIKQQHPPNLSLVKD